MAKVEIDLTFDSIHTLIKEKSSGAAEMDALDNIASVLLLLSPAVMGPAGMPALGFLGAKNELTKLGKKAWSKITTEPIKSKLNRFELLSTAYGLTCYAAFFEAVDSSMPEIYEGFGLAKSERLLLADNASAKIAAETNPGDDSDCDSRSALNFQIEIPHPTSSLEQDQARLGRLYELLSEGLSQFIRGLARWDEAPESQRDHINSILRDLPSQAAKKYKDLYLTLCVEFNEFGIWANLREHEITRIQFAKMSTQVQQIIKLRDESAATIDLGLKRVSEVLAMASHGPLSANSHFAIEDLRKNYQTRIDEPIIRDDYEDLSTASLRYPSRSEIFVPQAFRALRYSKALGPLEDEKVWSDISKSEDIGAFLLSYLSSPHSIMTPLVALGHPGSGKSLLTEIVAARLGGGKYTPIRVELRDINADSDIQMQLEEQIRLDTGRDAHWVDISAACQDAPPLVILDGYDELLQASGRVFSTYLQKVAAFQVRESRLNRPVRVLVTSRITLIDKAEIPVKSTVIRLEDFDLKRQLKWIATWNDYNKPYFTARRLNPLVLPTQEKINLLAQQPLLLLMLALYDSEGNKLAGQKAIDQTLLYDSLLRRFIERERSKGSQGLDFGALEPHERKAEIDRDMKRLGVAAIGMYNRRSLHIAKDDLQQDINYFETSRNSDNDSGPKLNQAELLLGSFFFVHESRSRVQGGSAAREPDAAAFEFLHNTFGEFLTADFILSVVLKQSEEIRSLQNTPGLSEHLASVLKEGKLHDAWYASLMFTPLYTRPVILSMLSEWGRHRLASLGREFDHFADDLDQIIYSQYRRLIQGLGYPPLVAGESAHPFPTRGVIDNVAIFTLNLALIRTAILGSFPFDSRRLNPSETGSSAWDRMTHLWRSALGLGGLEGLSRVVQSVRTGHGVNMSLRIGTVPETSGRLELTFETATALGDDLLAVLTGWALQDVAPSSSPELSRLLELDSTIDSGLAVEMSRRESIRRNYMFGFSGMDASDLSEFSPEVTGSSFAPAPFAFSFYGDHSRSESDRPDFFLSLPAEFGFGFWENWRIDNIRAAHVEEYRAIDDGFYRKFIDTRVLAAAECISSLGLISLDFEEIDAEGRHDGQVIFAARVAKVALRIGVEAPESLPSEVALELIALLPPTEIPIHLQEAYLDALPDPWALATRSSATIRRLMTASLVTGRRGLIEEALSALLPQRAGAKFVYTSGMCGSLAILKAAAAVGALEGKAHALDGIIGWILSSCKVEEPYDSFSSILSILEVTPNWVNHQTSPERLCALFGIAEPENVLDSASLRELDLYRKRFDKYVRSRRSDSRKKA